MQAMSSILTSSISQSQNKSSVHGWQVAHATKEKIFLFLSQIEQHSTQNQQIEIPTRFKNIFELAAKSFFSVEVSRSGETMGLFFYGLDCDLDVEKWAIPISIQDFDFSGSLFLTWFSIRAPLKKTKELIFNQNLKFVFSQIFRLSYILVPSQLLQNANQSNFFHSSEILQDFGKKFKIISKTDILPPLIIRVAREEDHDDLVAICDNQSELKTNQHGNYFIAELIASQNEDKICLVAENEDSQVVGMMLVSLRMDLSILNSHFDLKPFDLFCKSDFSRSVFRFQEMETELERVQAEVAKLKSMERIRTLKQLCSFPLNVRLLQNFVVDHVEEHISDFESYLLSNSLMEDQNPALSKHSSKMTNHLGNLKEEDTFKKKNINNFILGKLIDKHLKHLKMAQPDPAFQTADDHEIQTWILSPRDFLFRVLCHFGLPHDYLDGGGHWKLWATRYIEKKVEEQRNKNFMGKRRNKYSKKRGHEQKTKEVELPPGFDIEPFVNSLKLFSQAHLETRHKICEFFGAHQKTLLRLFCDLNGELDESKELPFHVLLDAFQLENMEEELDKQTQSLILPILESFGNLSSREEFAHTKDKKKYRFKPAKVVVNNSTLKSAPDFLPHFQLNRKRLVYVRLKSLFEAVERIAFQDSFYKNRGAVLDDLEHFFNSELNLLDKAVKSHYSGLNLQHFDSVKRSGVNQAIQRVPNNILNAGCISLFFMDNDYQSRATDFLPFVFSKVRSRDYLIMTQPQIVNETILLQHFQKVPQKSDSNFGHCLYIFHRSNLFSQYLKVQTAFPDEFEYLKRKFFADQSETDSTHRVIKNTVDCQTPRTHVSTHRTGTKSTPSRQQMDSVINRNRDAVREIFTFEPTKEAKIESQLSKVKLRFQQPTFTSAVQTLTALNAFSIKNTSKGFEEGDEKKTSNGFDYGKGRKGKRKRVGRKLLMAIAEEKLHEESLQINAESKTIQELNSDDSYLKLVFETPDRNTTTIIGLAQVSKNTQSLNLFKRYNISSVMDPNFLSKPDFLRLTELHINPLFHPFKNYLLREALRRNKAHVLVIAPRDLPQIENVMSLVRPVPHLPLRSFFYKNHAEVEGKGYHQNYQGLKKSLNYFYDTEIVTPNEPVSDIRQPGPVPGPVSVPGPVPLLSLTLNQLATQKRRINIRLVIVGNSTTSVGVLKHLLNLPDLDFNNITLISTKFLNQDWFLNTNSEELESSDLYLQRMFLEKKTRLIQGKMETLDRKNKIITVKNLLNKRYKIRYDYLVITTGLVDKTFQLLKQKGTFNNVFSLKTNEDQSSQNIQNMSNTSGGDHKPGLMISSGTGDKTSQKTGPESANYFTKPKKGDKDFKGGVVEPIEPGDEISVNTDFFVSVDDLQSDLRAVLKHNPDVSNKEQFLSKLAKQKSWAGKLLHRKIPQNVVLYGESPQIFALLESLLSDFNLNLSKINLLLPARSNNHLDYLGLKTEPSNLSCQGDKKISNEETLRKMDNRVDFPVLFENSEIREFYLSLLEYFGVNVLRDYEILGLCEIENSLLVRYNSESEKKKQMYQSQKTGTDNKENAHPFNPLLESEKTKNQICPEFLENVRKLQKDSYFFDLNTLSPDVLQYLDTQNPTLTSHSQDIQLFNEESEEENKKMKQRFGYTKEVNEEGDDLLQDAIVFMGNTFDVGNTVFRAIQDNGLVYNGRLIVTNNFKTIDKFIYACGKISEFSQRYLTKGLGRSLKLDKFDGFEVGVHFARQFEAMLRDEPFVEGHTKTTKSKLNWIDIWISQWSQHSRKNNFNPTHAKNIMQSPIANSDLMSSKHSPPDNPSRSGSNSRPKSVKQNREEEKKEWSQLLELNKKEPSFEGQIPHLQRPKAFKLRLFPGYYFVQVKKPFRGLLDLNQPRYFESTNTLSVDIDYWLSESSQQKIEKLEQSVRQQVAQERLENAQKNSGSGPYIFSNVSSNRSKSHPTGISSSQNTVSNYTNTTHKDSSQYNSPNVSSEKNSKRSNDTNQSNTASGTVGNTISGTISGTVTGRGNPSDARSGSQSFEPSTGRMTDTSRIMKNEQSLQNQESNNQNNNPQDPAQNLVNLEQQNMPCAEIQTAQTINEEPAPRPAKPPIQTGHYLLLEFDEHHQVSKIEYFGRDEPSLECLVNLCGLHRSFFNLMFERRQAGLVDDFATFISQEWASFLGHPVFPQLATYARGLFHLTFRKHSYSSRTLELAYAEGLSLMRKKFISESRIQPPRLSNSIDIAESDLTYQGVQSEVQHQNGFPHDPAIHSSKKAHLNLKDCQKEQASFQNNLFYYQTEQHADQKEREFRQRVHISKTEHIWDDLLSDLPQELKRDLMEQIEVCIARFRPVFAKSSV